nr:ATP-dependent DNA helicase PIF2-like [Tanacetum cinerariifolium]
MPYPNVEFTMEGYNWLIYDERDYKIPELITQHQELYESLTDEQRGISETIVSACDNNKGGMFFVYGYGGTDGDLAELIREAKLIIWDEAPMITRLAYEAFDRTLRDICTDTYTSNSNKVFGGKVVAFGGDFRQILPIIPNGSRQDVVYASLNMSYLWQHCTVLKLTKNMRLRVGCNPEDAEEINDFADWILNIGEETYGNWQHNLWDPTYFQERAILAHTHEQWGNLNLDKNEANSSGPSFFNVEHSSTSTTSSIDKTGKLENLIIDGQSTIVDDAGNPLKKVKYPGDHDSDDEVASVDNDMARSMASERVGFGTQSLLEQ